MTEAQWATESNEGERWIEVAGDELTICRYCSGRLKSAQAGSGLVRFGSGSKPEREIPRLGIGIKIYRQAAKLL
jgi:hypothetical protein